MHCRVVQNNLYLRLKGRWTPPAKEFTVMNILDPAVPLPDRFQTRPSVATPVLLIPHQIIPHGTTNLKTWLALLTSCVVLIYGFRNFVIPTLIEILRLAQIKRKIVSHLLQQSTFKDDSDLELENPFCRPFFADIIYNRRQYSVYSVNSVWDSESNDFLNWNLGPKR